MAQMCYLLEVMPHQGGLLDQDPLHVMVITAAYTGFKLAERRKESSNAPGNKGRPPSNPS